MSVQETIVCTLLFLIGGFITYRIQARQRWTFPLNGLIFMPGLLLAQLYSFAISAPGDQFINRIMVTDQPIFYGFPISFFEIPAWDRPVFFISFILLTLVLTFVLGFLYSPHHELAPAAAQLFARSILVLSGLFAVLGLIIGIWGIDPWFFIPFKPTLWEIIFKTTMGYLLWGVVLSMVSVVVYRLLRYQGKPAAAVLFLQMLVLDPFLRWVAALNGYVASFIVFVATLIIVTIIWQASPELQTFNSTWLQRIRGRNSHPLT